MNAEDTRITALDPLASSSLARQSVDDENVISKNRPLLISQEPNNAQNTQHKLGVGFSYLERNN